MKRFLAALFLLVPSGLFPQEKIFESIHVIASPAPEQSGQPYLFADSEGAVLLSWIESRGPEGHVFRFSRLRDSGWSEPRTIAAGKDFFVNWADVPAIMKTTGGLLTAHWLRRSAGSPYAYDINLAVSNDGGLSWSGPLKPHNDTTKTEHGFVSFYEAGEKTAGLVWLDGRNMIPEGPGHAGHGSGSMTLRAGTIDSRGRPGTERVIDDRVCECCPTAVATTPRGLVVAYRNRSDEEVRDIHILRSVDGTWKQPFAIRDDGWQIPGCPVNGPALASRGRDIAVAWFTAADGVACVFVSFSDNEGESFAPAFRIDEGKPLGRVALAMAPDGSAIVLWIGYREEKGELLARRVWPDGKRSDTFKVADVSAERASGYPRMVVTGNGAVIAWTDVEKGKRVKVAIGKLR